MRWAVRMSEGVNSAFVTRPSSATSIRTDTARRGTRGRRLQSPLDSFSGSMGRVRSGK